jgi:hypothetical protein
MDSLIVLGLIPGTHIQITFAAWVISVVGLSVWLVLRFIRSRHFIRTALLVVAFSRFSRRLQV